MKKYLSLVLLFVILIMNGCGLSKSHKEKKNSEIVPKTSKYTLPNKNVAVLGPLEGASVKIYKLTDLNNSIFNTTTGKFGSFDVDKISLNDDDFVLVEVKGGKDIDVNDDGIIDKKPMINKGIIHGFATVKDLKDGKVHITLISELVYQYTKHLLPKINKEITVDDFKNIVSVVSQFFIKTEKINDGYEKLITFNPIINKKELKIDYNKLLIGKNSLVSLYHKGDNEKEIINKLKTDLFTLPITLNDDRLINARKNYKITFVSNNIEYNVTGVKLKDSVGFVKKDSNVTFKITDIDSNYKILKWNGCDFVSDDLKTCKLINIEKNRFVVAVVVPEKIKLKSGMVIKDISNAYIDIDKNNSLANKEINMTIFSDIGDKNTSKLLSTVEVNNIIIHKTDPVFFGKVVNIKKINDFRYKVQVEKVPLDSLIEKGYISIKSDKIGFFNSTYTKTSKVLSKALILPNGKKISFDPNKPATITLQFDKDRILFKAKYPKVETSHIENGIRGKVDFSENTSITGELTLTPKFDYDLVWNLWDGVKLFYVKIGENVNSDIKVESSKEFNLKKDIKLIDLTFTQTIMVGPFPIVLDEPISIYLGVDGKLNIKGNIGIIESISPTISLAYSKKSGVQLDYTFNPTTEYYGNINGDLDAFAYFGIFPSFEIYGIGVGFDNKIGLYTIVNGEADEDVKHFVEATKLKAAAGLWGEYGIKYVGELNLTSSWKILKDPINKINDKLAPQYVKKWKLGDFNFSKKIADTHEEKPGILNVVGPKNDFISKNIDELTDLNKVYTYKLVNNGGKKIYYKVIFNGNLDYTVDSGTKTTSKEICGELDPGDEKDINLNILPDGIDKIGLYYLNTTIYQSNNDICTNGISLLSLPIFTSNITLQVKPNDLSSLPKTNFDVNVSGKTIKQLTFSWKKYDKLNGYKIYMGDYNKTKDSCSNIRLFANIESNVDHYSEDLLSLMNTTNNLRKIEPNKSYCFVLTGYKKYYTIDGDTEIFEKTISDFVNITPIKVKDSNETDTNSSKNVELDLMFLVDMTGSYYDDLDTFKKESKNIVNLLKTKLPKNVEVKIGLSMFQDFPNTSYDSSTTDKPYELELGLTTDLSKFNNAINNLKVGDGGDYPEAQLEGLYRVITDPNVGWNKSAIKIILLFTDASFHDKDRDPDYPGHGSSEVKHLLSANNISVIGIGSGGITEDLKNISDYTFELSSDSSGVVEAINELLESIPGTNVTDRRYYLPKRKVNVIPNYMSDTNDHR